ncbi:TY2B-LR1 [Symbiodinium sp. CCMP2592]|nr:TY2B-LR1 [Symbiodinium sp. CCMP2592]
MTQIAFPADLLRQLQENVSFDLGAIEDIRAAMQEISDRLNHRTGILGQAVQSLDSGHRQVFEGCVTVENQLEEFKRILRAQQTVIEEQASTWTREMAAMRDRLEDNQAVINQQLVVIDQAKQREALLLAKVESMAGRLNEMETMLSSMSASVNEHKGRLSIHETYISAAVSSQATGSQEGDAGAAEGDLAVQVRMLAERVDQELAQIARGDAHDAEAGSLKDLNAAVDQLDERVTALETSMEEWENADCEDDQRPCESEAHVGGMPQRFDLTPNLQDTPTWGNQEPADEQEPDATAMWWQQPFEFSSTEHSANVSIGRPTQNVWGISDPPGLPAYLRAPNVVADNAADPGQGNVAPVPAAPPPKAKAVRKSPPVVPKGGYGQANKATPGLHADHDFVLVDSGANEVLRPGEPPRRGCETSLQLADGMRIKAFRSREGELVIPGATWICGLSRLVSLGYKFVWSRARGPYLQTDDDFPGEIRTINLIVMNGLPYVRWEDFVEVRRYLTQQYKQCNRKVCSVTVPMCPEASSILDIEEVMAHVADDLECCEASLVAVEPATDHDESKESQFDAVLDELHRAKWNVWNHAVWRKTHDDKPPAKGRLLSTSRTIAEFDPFQMHGTEPFRGHRIVVTAFTPAAGQQTSERMRAHLEGLGFPIHDRHDDDGTRRVEINTVLQQQHQQQQQQGSTCAPAEGAPEPLENALGVQGVQGVQGSLGDDQGVQDCFQGLPYFGEVVEVSDGELSEDLFPELVHSTKQRADEQRPDCEDNLDVYEPSLPEEEKPVDQGPESLPPDAIPKPKPGRTIDDLRTRGLRRPHLRLSAEQVATGVMSIDLAGPYREGYDGARYMLVAVLRLADGCNLQYTRPLRHRHWQLVYEQLQSILSQIAATSHDLGLLTVEEREYGPEEAKEADFFQAAKCEAACNKAVESSAKDAEVTKSRDKNLEWLEGKTCTVCGKSSKACYLEKLDKVTPEPCGYQVPGFDEEAEMVEQERLAQELKSFKASAEPCGNDVFFGPRREDWIGAARKELDNMTVHQKVWIEVRKGHIHEDLGLDRSVKLPKALPMQLVNTLKPLNESSGPIDEPKVRIVACGNFQHDSQDKEDLSTQNVDMSVLRTMAKETALRPSWIMGAGDISAAFLNTFLGGKDLVILEPPAVLKRLGLIAEDVQYVPIRAIYGLRRSPLDWSRDRDGKISGKVLTDDQGRQIHCVPIAHQDGLWKLLCGDTLVGLVAMYVDDCLVTGERSAVEAFLQFVSAEWRTKIQGFIARQTDVQVKCNDEQVAQKQALNFLGVEISFEGDKIVIQQRRWILQELNRRGWVHMKGSQSLPQLEMAEDEALDEHHAKNLANARSEIGALMWIGIRSRPDVLAAVSMGASVMHRRPEAICKFCVGLWRYVRGTLDECLQYGPDGNPGEMTFISDASFAPEGSRSRTGGVLCYAGSVIHWFSCRQTVTAWSVCEAETDALAETLSQGIRLTYVLQDLLHKPVTRCTKLSLRPPRKLGLGARPTNPPPRTAGSGPLRELSAIADAALLNNVSSQMPRLGEVPAEQRRPAGFENAYTVLGLKEHREQAAVTLMKAAHEPSGAESALLARVARREMICKHLPHPAACADSLDVLAEPPAHVRIATPAAPAAEASQEQLSPVANGL